MCGVADGQRSDRSLVGQDEVRATIGLDGLHEEFLVEADGSRSVA